MKKIKRHLSFTLRQREHDDVLVKKDAISPIFTKKAQGKHGKIEVVLKIPSCLTCSLGYLLNYLPPRLQRTVPDSRERREPYKSRLSLLTQQGEQEHG